MYSPALIVEVLSPKVNRQRIIALSAGTREFWVVDPNQRTIEVKALTGTKMFGNSTIPVDFVFNV